MSKLSEMTPMPPPNGDRVPINIHPETRSALIGLLFTDPWRGVGYSEFLNRAIERAKAELVPAEDPFRKKIRDLANAYEGSSREFLGDDLYMELIEILNEEGAR